MTLLYLEYFEGAIYHARDPYGNVINEITTVNGWTPYWTEDSASVVLRPEAHVIDSATNPNFLEPVCRVNSAGRGLKVFKLFSRHDAGYYKQFVVPAGTTDLWVQAHGHHWYSQRDDARWSEYERDGVWYRIADGDPGAYMWVGIDPTGGTDPYSERVQWSRESIYDGHDAVTAELERPGAIVTVFLRSTQDHPFKHSDAYWSSVEIRGYVDGWDPLPGTCRGTPREQYARTYWLLPQTATEAQAAQVLKLAYPTRGTVGFSADDAGLGDLESRDVRVMWFGASDWNRDALDAFFAEHYPGVSVVHELLYTPPVEPEPEPGEEPQHPDPGVLIGLHSQLPKTGWLDFYRHVKPGIFKAVDQLGMCIEAKDASPDTLVVFRRHVTDDAYWFNQPDKRAAARAFLDLYSASFEAHASNTGMSLSDVLAHVDVVESVNEVIGTYDQDLEPSVAFEVAFMEAVAERYGNALRAGILTIAVGNPHESEFVKLLPAARAAAEGGHYLGYHPYWAANRDVSYLLPHWAAHAGRWQAMDDVFRAHGVYPLWYGGEAGVVYSEDGWTLHSGLGWKACGSFARYITELLTFQNHARIWNCEHGNRFRGATVFCYGGYGWDNFDFEPGDLSELGAAL